MEIRYIQTFLAVAEERSMLKAAMKLNYSQPTVSKHIKALEDEFGIKLFEVKDGTRILSSAGSVLYGHSKQILNELQDLGKDMSALTEQKTIIRVGGMAQYCCSVFIPAALPFMDRHPNASISIEETTNDGAYAAAVAKQLDICAVVGKPFNDNLIERVIGFEDLILAASRDVAQKFTNLDDFIADHPVLLDQNATYIDYGLLRQGVRFPRTIHCSSDEAIVHGMREAGFLGLIGTGRIEKELASGELVSLHTFSNKVAVKIIASKTSLENKEIQALFSFIDAFSKKA